MSFSNTSTGGKPSDPYKAANLDTEADLSTKVHDLVDFVTNCKFGMLTTVEASTNNLVSRCMALTSTEAGGLDLLFHTNTESGKTNDLKQDSHVNLSFINGSGEWASISGQASISTDRALVAKTYTPALKAWLGDLGDGVHDGSEKDPRIGIILVKTNTATYSRVASNFLSRAAEIAKGAVTGQAAQVNKLREISAAEVTAWRGTH